MVHGINSEWETHQSTARLSHREAEEMSSCVEYELPNQPKPPAGQRVEPLLMIHPCYFRKMESQRRSPFVNNMHATARAVSSSSLSSGAALGGGGSGLCPQQQSSLEHVRRQHQQQQQQQQQRASSNQSQRQSQSQSHAANSAAAAAAVQAQAQASIAAAAAGQWDQLAAALAARTALTPHHMLHPHGHYAAKGSGAGAASGKRDAMISGSNYGQTAVASGKLQQQQQQQQQSQVQQQQHQQQQHCLPPPPWDATSMLMDRAPMATVPSNYQAGPDTNPMRLYSATPTSGAATGGSASVGGGGGGGAVGGTGATGAVTTATDKLSGKYRQYLRSQRMHPYAAAASLNLAAAAAAAGQTSFVPFSSAATPTFQHLPQISCYNV
ncbi:hypothetical protein M5D96_002977 [Drosophila gunungcola]|uniref:Centrosomal and chromosomal factor n=1 Tax=Drosophila gunungcola TaxID=103775 RepID=A0A9P9Z121_9MUSC|nr:hypothetical protein M5D96_002977 [Drosophila gunungcola]